MTTAATSPLLGARGLGDDAWLDLVRGRIADLAPWPGPPLAPLADRLLRRITRMPELDQDTLAYFAGLAETAPPLTEPVKHKLAALLSGSGLPRDDD